MFSYNSNNQNDDDIKFLLNLFSDSFFVSFLVKLFYWRTFFIYSHLYRSLHGYFFLNLHAWNSNEYVQCFLFYKLALVFRGVAANKISGLD